MSLAVRHVFHQQLIERRRAWAAAAVFMIVPSARLKR